MQDTTPYHTLIVKVDVMGWKALFMLQKAKHFVLIKFIFYYVIANSSWVLSARM